MTASAYTPEDLVAFVEKAFLFAHTHGRDAALREFNDRNGRFVKDGLYIFAYDFEGNTLSAPYEQHLIGKNRMGDSDAYGTAYIEEATKAARAGGGFIRYFYADPGANFEIHPKLGYIMRVDENWWIGAGLYNVEAVSMIIASGMDPVLRGDLTAFVEIGLAFANKQSRDAAVSEFNDRHGRFVRGDRYIHAFDFSGVCLAHPIRPEHVGKDLSGEEDSKGVRFIMVESYLAKHEGGFVFYHYPNPAHGMAVEPTMNYVRKVDDAWWIGTGIFLSAR